MEIINECKGAGTKCCWYMQDLDGLYDRYNQPTVKQLSVKCKTNTAQKT